MSQTSLSTDAVRRPRLLVSVRDVAEAEAAIAGGADWIDLKEPSAGPLGAVSVATAHEVVEHVAGRRPISAALGEIVDWPTALSRQLLDVPEIGVVKLGLAGFADVIDWQVKWLAAVEEIHAAGKSLVAVVYADWRRAYAPRPYEIIELAQQTACRYLLIDTFDKGSPSTVELLGRDELREILKCGLRANMRTVLAGGIKSAEVAQLPLRSLDLVAVRGAVCRYGREGTVDSELVGVFTYALTGLSRQSAVHEAP